MGLYWVYIGFIYWVYIGIMEKKMETTTVFRLPRVQGLGVRVQGLGIKGLGFRVQVLGLRV